MIWVISERSSLYFKSTQFTLDNACCSLLWVLCVAYWCALYCSWQFWCHPVKLLLYSLISSLLFWMYIRVVFVWAFPCRGIGQFGICTCILLCLYIVLSMDETTWHKPGMDVFGRVRGNISSFDLWLVSWTVMPCSTCYCFSVAFCFCLLSSAAYSVEQCWSYPVEQLSFEVCCLYSARASWACTVLRRQCGKQVSILCPHVIAVGISFP